MEIIAIITSVFAVTFSIFTYWKHDLKIKQQTTLLNEYLIAKIEEEKEESIKAIVKANVISGDRGNRTIKIYNAGKSIAKDVNVIIPNIAGLHVMNNPSPIDIHPQNEINILLSVAKGCPNKISINIE